MDTTKKNHYKYCIVPMCTNTSITTPGKHFFNVPKKKKIRDKWCEVMKRKETLSEKSVRYCCEDHFDVEKDMDNYVKFKLVGGMLKLKQGVVPHKFACQLLKNDRLSVKIRPPPPRPCSSCLSYGRELKPLGDLTELYSTLVPGVKKVKELKICWECRGVLRRCASFQQHAMRAQETLENKKKPKIKDNSFSLFPLITKAEVIKISIYPELLYGEPTEKINAVNVETNVQKDKNDPLALEVESNAMNINTKPKNKKRKKEGNSKDVADTTKVTDATSVEIEIPAVNLEEQEPLCEIEDIKMEIEDPLIKKEWEENDLNASAEEIKTEKLKELNDKKRKRKKIKKKGLCESENMSIKRSRVDVSDY